MTAMVITDYTSYAEVRSVLGVSTKELLDATLSLPAYLAMLEMSLTDINPLAFQRTQEIFAIDVGSRTALQATFFKTVQVYSMYTMARLLATSLPMFAVQKITDGKAEFDRFDAAYKDIIDGIDAGYVSFQWRVGLALQALENNPGIVVPSFGVAATSQVAGLGQDPVTADT